MNGCLYLLRLFFLLFLWFVGWLVGLSICLHHLSDIKLADFSVPRRTSASSEVYDLPLRPAKISKKRQIRVQWVLLWFAILYQNVETNMFHTVLFFMQDLTCFSGSLHFVGSSWFANGTRRTWRFFLKHFTFRCVSRLGGWNVTRQARTKWRHRAFLGSTVGQGIATSGNRFHPKR